MLHPLPLADEPAAAIQPVHGAVESPVRLLETF